MKSIDPPSAIVGSTVPRPHGHRIGSPAPWDGLPDSGRRGISLDRVRAALADVGGDGGIRPGQGRRAADRIGPAGDSPPGGWSGRGAAVLVPLFEEDGETRVILTVRSDQLRSHRGEVAFPGGRLDEGEGIVDAALREAYEEVGIRPEAVTVIGELTTMPTISSDTVMAPVVGALDRRPQMTANPGEVARVFDVALADLAAGGVFHEEWWPAPERAAALGIPGDEIPVWFFEVADVTVWGATARCLTQLVCVALGVPMPPSLVGPPPPG
jgi:8-oxo-dGTP pyrophosphatase MutT (NUDIX family)